MRKLLWLLMPLLFCCNAWAISIPEEIEEYVPQEIIENVQRGENPIAESLEWLWKEICGELGGAIQLAVRSAASMMVLILLCGIIEGVGASFGNKSKQYLPYFSVLAVTLLSAGDLTVFIGLGKATIEELSTFSKALLPTVAMAMAAGGNVASASVWQVGTLMASDLLLQLTENTLLPFLYCYIGLSAAGSILPESRLDKLAGAIKTIIKWVLCAAALVFTTYLTLSNVLSGTADKLSVKAGKTVISGAIPVVGGILSEATEAVLSGAGVLRGTVGVLGVAAVLSISLLPLLRLAIEFLLYQAVAFFSAASGAEAVQKYIEQLSNAFILLLAMTACAAFFLLAALFVSVLMVTEI